MAENVATYQNFVTLALIQSIPYELRSVRQVCEDIRIEAVGQMDMETRDVRLGREKLGLPIEQRDNVSDPDPREGVIVACRREVGEVKPG